MVKSAVVTGAFGALGQAVTACFQSFGVQVACIDYAPVPAGWPEGGVAIGDVDLADPSSAEQALREAAERLGGIDALINVAGGFVWQKFEDGDPASWLKLYALNLQTTANAIKAALPFLLNQSAARIVNVGAFAALRADTGMGAYAASKSAVHRLTETLAAEFADRDITVNAVLPSIIDTPTNRRDMPDADTSTWVKPRAIADVIAFLCSAEAGAISGALIPVTRGG
ncbi:MULTISPECIES: SDR family NAD(P)-dependent oxidoreductase [Sphingobium]|uniref:SDR family NAD(P)-dependent oxidoreductase n=1 Tax=Sphingobium TaxID=165695 RepID=UPI00159C7DF8|nr:MULTISPECIES: SDR family NAD(P)-dependent oxidoreductase [unclassified Sphingobium]